MSEIPEDPDKYCQTNRGPMLWKDIAQDYADELERQRSSLNPEWERIRLDEREACAKIAEQAALQSYSPHQHPMKIAEAIRR